MKTTKENIHYIIFLINSDEGLSANMINICYDEFNNIINKLKNFDPKIKSIVWNLISLIIKRNEL